MHADLDTRLATAARGPRTPPDVDELWLSARRQRRLRRMAGATAGLATVALVTLAIGLPSPQDVRFAGSPNDRPTAPLTSAGEAGEVSHGFAEVSPETVRELLTRAGGENVEARVGHLNDDITVVQGTVVIAEELAMFTVYEAPDPDHLKDIAAQEGFSEARIQGGTVVEASGPANEAGTVSHQLLVACDAKVINLIQMARPENPRGGLHRLAEGIIRQESCNAP